MDIDYERFERSNETYKDSKTDYYKAMGRFNGSLEFSICALQVAVIAFGLIAALDVNAVWTILAGIVVGLVYTSIRKKKSGGEEK